MSVQSLIKALRDNHTLDSGEEYESVVFLLHFFEANTHSTGWQEIEKIEKQWEESRDDRILRELAYKDYEYFNGKSNARKRH